MTQRLDPPATTRWMFKLSGLQLERGTWKKKSPICRSKGTWDSSVSLFLKPRLVIPDQAYSPLRPYQMLRLSGRCQSSSQLNWHLEEQGTWREPQRLQFRRQLEEHVVKTREHTVRQWTENRNSHGNLGFIPLSSSKRNVSGQEGAGEADYVLCNNILHQRHGGDAFLLNRNMRWEM